MTQEIASFIYIVITDMESCCNPIMTGKMLRKRGYERLGNGFYFVRIRKEFHSRETIEEELAWLSSRSLAGKVVHSTNGLRRRYSPYRRWW